MRGNPHMTDVPLDSSVELLRKAQSGDGEALNDLLKKYGKPSIVENPLFASAET